MLFAIFVSGQEMPFQSGKWHGNLKISGFELDMQVQLEFQNGVWSGLLDVPVQGIKGMELSGLQITEDSLQFALPQVPGNASFNGEYTDEHNVSGIFTQAGQQISLTFTKEDEIARKAEKERIEHIAIRLRALADSVISLQNLPGMALGIVKDGEVVLAEGFGKRDVENEIEVTSKTLFAIGSCSKAFTAMDVAMLVEEGAIEWDKPVVEYMPDFQLHDEFATKEMNAIDLLTHQSGLPRHDLMWYGSTMDRYEMFSRLKYLPPSKSFRSAYQYQNLMYMTAGILVEKLSGKSWEAFTREKIIEPLEMNKTIFSWDDLPDDSDVALGYIKNNDSLIATPYRDIVNVAPAGSIVSNVDDMLHWVQFLLDQGKYDGKELVKSETIQFIQQGHKVIENSESATNPEFSGANYGLGWGIGYYNGVKLVSHGGAIDGFSAYVVLVPKEDIGMVALCNAGGAGGANTVLTRTAMDLLLEFEEIDWYTRIFGEEEEEDSEEGEEETKSKEPVPNTQPSHPLQDYAGIYEHPGYGKIEIVLENDSLGLLFNAFDEVLSHWHYDVFQFDIPLAGLSMKVNFYSNADGYIDRLSLPIEQALEEDFYFKKLPPDLMAKTYLSRILGDYTLNDSGTAVKVSRTGGKLYVVVTGQPPYELEAYQEDEFRLKALNGYSVKFYFEGNSDDSKYLEFLQPNGIFKADRQKMDN